MPLSMAYYTVAAKRVQSHRPDVLRSILIAVDVVPEALRALDWATSQLFKPGDNCHIAHVIKSHSPQTEVFHGIPGTAYKFPDPAPLNERQEITMAKQFLKDRVTTPLDAQGIPNHIHLFVEEHSAPASAIGELLIKVADEVKADVVVLGTNDKTTAERWMMGSVADYCSNNMKHPLVLVR
ncbi:hypothetical protein WJX72_011979 [[Myrmecia] bisecta]|uniref:UspA domain-containing protein n=1 Tax=[Myrmecia] bisecta TaxID=41462 RepID=A0AAW1Q176_9CHLO